MGYTTEFEGKVTIDPPLNAKEVKYLTKFNETRRMDRENGPYFVGGTGPYGQGDDPDVRDHNSPPEGQPGLWCQWTPGDVVEDDMGEPVSASSLEWDGGEKFYYATEWMRYLIDHFLSHEPLAKLNNKHFDFLQGHTVNGTIYAEGEDPGDNWKIVVKDNIVTEVQGHVVYDDE